MIRIRFGGCDLSPDGHPGACARNLDDRFPPGHTWLVAPNAPESGINRLAVRPDALPRRELAADAAHQEVDGDRHHPDGDAVHPDLRRVADPEPDRHPV